MRKNLLATIACAAGAMLCGTAFAGSEMKSAVLVIAPGGFRDEEFTSLKAALERQGIRTIVAGDAPHDQKDGRRQMKAFIIFPVDHYDKSFREVLIADILAQLSEECRAYGNLNGIGWKGDGNRIVVAVDHSCGVKLLAFLEMDEGVRCWEVEDDARIGIETPSGEARIARAAFCETHVEGGGRNG